MANTKIEAFLEKVNMNYMFCLLSKLEAERINDFPEHVKQKFGKKVPVVAMEHVAENEVPDYLVELAEAEKLLAEERSKYMEAEEEDEIEFREETVDDSAKYTQDLERDTFEEYEDNQKVDDPFGGFDDDEDDIDYDDYDDDDE